MFKLSKLALIGALSVAFMSCGSVAHATDPHKESYISVGRLINDYHSDSDHHRIFALGYIGGVHDALIGTLVCMPGGDNLGKLAKNVIDLMSEGVNKGWILRTESAGTVLASTLVRAFPCAPKGKNV
jgi:hypothetical protein